MPKARSRHERLASPKTRPQSSYQRKEGRRLPRPAILVVCEGRETEPRYFRALRRDLRLALVDVEPVGGPPLTVVQRAMTLTAERSRKYRRAQKQGGRSDPPFDQVWCVFDVERLQDNASFLDAVDLARAQGFELAISNPAFEFWYLLHFEDTSRLFHDADELGRALEQHVPVYVKSVEMYDRLKPLTDTAIGRADRVLLWHAATAQSFPNPSTTVHRLVRLLRSMAIR